MNIKYESYFAHHGILGQKWGVRRYQNEDGTRTEAGKKRYKGYSEDALRKNELNRKRNNQLSNKELQELNTRLNLENQRLENSKRNMSTGKQFIKSILIGATTATVSGLAYKYGPRVFEKGAKFVSRHVKDVVEVVKMKPISIS